MPRVQLEDPPPSASAIRSRAFRERQKTATATPPTSHASTVWVASKLPNDHILHLEKEYTVDEQTPSGPRALKLYQRTQQITIKGTATPVGVPIDLIASHRLTQVPADFWREWYSKNQNYWPVAEKLIFAKANIDDVRAKARDNEKRKTGLEEFDPDNPGSRIKGIEKGTTD